jgi:hypothetical protein
MGTSRPHLATRNSHVALLAVANCTQAMHRTCLRLHGNGSFPLSTVCRPNLHLFFSQETPQGSSTYSVCTINPVRLLASFHAAFAAGGESSGLQLLLRGVV